MALTEHYYTKFEENRFYHIYNRSVDKKPMFKNEGNYEFFLRNYDKYLSPVIDTYAYCLLGNHFHLLIKVKNISDMPKPNLSTSGVELDPIIHNIVSSQFRKFFQSYSMAFNKQQDRTGTLFQTPFKRALVNDDNYFTQLVYYTHANPQAHGLIDDFRDWKWSSYGRALLDTISKLKKEEVVNWFGNKELYKQYHASHHKFILEDRLCLDDL